MVDYRLIKCNYDFLGEVLVPSNREKAENLKLSEYRKKIEEIQTLLNNEQNNLAVLEYLMNFKYIEWVFYIKYLNY